LDVPAGRADMQLALSYSSGGGNGILGVGWSLSGLSRISRCKQTLSSDGHVRGVHLTDMSADATTSDRFCLDGKKLIAIAGTSVSRAPNIVPKKTALPRFCSRRPQ
jgi:hypothetical protein